MCLLATPSSASESQNKELYNKAQSIMDFYSGNRQELEQALTLIKSIESNNPDSIYALVGYGRLFFKAGYIKESKFEPRYLEQSKSYFDKAILKNPKFADVYLYGAYPYIFDDKLKKARLMVLEGKKLLPNSPRVALLLGEIAEREKDFEASARHAKQVIQMNPSKKILIDGYRLLRTSYIARKKYTIAEPIYLKLIELEPGSAWPKGNYSNFLRRYLKDYDKAIVQGNRALKQMDYGIGRHVTGLAYYRKAEYLNWKKHNHREAIPNYLQAIKLKPRHANAHYGLGVSYYRIGNIDKDKRKIIESKKHTLMAIKLNPKHKKAIKFLKNVEGVLEYLEKG